VCELIYCNRKENIALQVPSEGLWCGEASAVALGAALDSGPGLG